MPNINSLIVDYASAAIKEKLHGDKKSKSPQPERKNPGNSSTSDKLLTGLNTAVTQIKSNFGAKPTKETSIINSYPTPGTDPMSGSGYPGYNPSGDAYGNQQYGGYPPQAGAYPGQQSAYGQPGAYPGQQQGGYGQQPGYPNSQFPQAGQQPQGFQPNLGFNQPGYGGSGGGYPGSGYPPQQQQPYSNLPQPYGQSGAYGQQAYPPPQPGLYPGANPQMNQNYAGSPYSGASPASGLSLTRRRPCCCPPSSSFPFLNYEGQTMSVYAPTIKANPNFNPTHVADSLHKAMKGFGCDKHKVIQNLISINNSQRQQVVHSFKAQFGKDLISELKSELSGDFENLVLALMELPAHYDAHQLYKAMAGLGTKEHVLIEIMTTRTNAQIHELKAVYKQMYKSDLEADLVSETSGYFKRILVALCQGARDESYQDAHALHQAGAQRIGTDESKFIQILGSQSYAQLRLAFEEYQKVAKHPIDKAIQDEFSGDIQKALLAIVKSIRNRPAYFAELLHESMKGLGTRDNDLIRLVVSRSEIDLIEVRRQYEILYKTPLEKAIKDDCSGAYKDGLIAIVRGN